MASLLRSLSDLRPRASWFVLAGLLTLAAVLRFAGLGWGLRHLPDWDEQVFVENAAAMVQKADLDQRFYQYPGLFFFILAGPLEVLRHVLPPGVGPTTYLAARAVVAAFGVASVALAYLLGARIAGSRGGLAAAFLLAASPIEVSTAHMVRPDVVLETFVLAALLAFTRLGPSLWWDAWAGVLMGAAGSVKPTGALLVPAYLVFRWTRPGRRLTGTLLCGTLAVLTLVGSTPAVFLNRAGLVRGFSEQWGQHYLETPTPLPMTSLAGFYLRTLVHALGIVGCAFAVFGLWAARRRVREWAGVLTYPLGLFLLLSTAQTHWVRLLLPAFGATLLAVALGYEALRRRWPGVALPVLVLGGLLPLSESARLAAAYLRPGTRDRVADWAEAHVPPGGTIVTSMREIGFGVERGEVLFTRNVEAQDRLIGGIAAAIVQPRSEPPLRSDQAVVATFAPVMDPEVEGPTIVVGRVPDAARRRLRPVSLEGVALRASSGEAQLAAAVDGSLETYWATSAKGPREEWIEARLGAPAEIARVSLRLGNRPARWGRRIRLSVSDDGRSWRFVETAAARPAVEEQAGADEGEASQVLLLEPVLARWLRVEAESGQGKRWGFAELAIDEADPASGRSR